MRKITFEELQPGDLLWGHGLVTRKGQDEYDFDGDRTITYIDYNDSYYGQCTMTAEDRELQIMHERDTEEYRKTVLHLITERSKYAKDVFTDVDLMISFLTEDTK